MKTSLTRLSCLALFGIVFTSCERQVEEVSINLVTAKPTSAKPFPAWTQQPSQSSSEQPIQITMKVIEVTRPSDSTEIPAKKYEGIFSESKLQEYLRNMAQKKGVDILTTPSVVMRDGENATVEIIREFIYPTGPSAGAEMATENTGVTSHLLAEVLDGGEIQLKSFTRVSELEGFAPPTAKFELPVFRRRDVEFSGRVKSGETIVLGGLVDEITKTVRDSTFFGIIKNSSEEALSRELIVVITAALMNPEGTTPSP